MQELKLITVKAVNEKKPKKYFVEADSLTDADAILAEELKVEYKVNPYKPVVYEDIVRLYPAESNPDDLDLLYYEVKFEYDNLDDKISSLTELVLCEETEDMLDYIKNQIDSNGMRLVSTKILPIECILKAKASKEEVEELINKFN